MYPINRFLLFFITTALFIATAANATDAVIVVGAPTITDSIDKGTEATKAVTNAINNVGEDNKLNNSQLTSVLQKINEQNQQLMRDLSVQQGTANAKFDALKQFGAHGIDRTCVPNAGTLFTQGKQAINQMALVGGQRVLNRTEQFSNAEGVFKDIFIIKRDELKIEEFYPPAGTLTQPQYDNAVKLRAMQMEPTPPVKLPPDLVNTPNGKKYTAQARLHELNKIGPVKAQTSVDAMRAPSAEMGKLAQSLADAMNASGSSVDKPKLVDGKLSYEELLNLQSNYRIGNDAWLKGAMQEKDDVWQLRQINVNTALLLEVQRKQLELLARITDLLAQQRSEEIDKNQGPALQDTYSRLISHDKQP